MSQLQSQPPHSSGKSSFSADTDGSSTREKKDKVEAKSEVRIYGRGESSAFSMTRQEVDGKAGGAQNIGKKVKDKDPKKAAPSKTGGFRGLKGIM